MRRFIPITFVLLGCATTARDTRPDAYLAMGIRALEEGDYAEAERAFLTAAQLGAGAFAWYMVGECRMKMGGLSPAKEAFERALQVESSYPLALDGLARVAVAQGRPEEALEIYDAMESHPGLAAYSEVKKARILLGMARVKEARELLITALTRSPYMPEAWYALAEAYMAEGRTDMAEGCLAKAISAGYPVQEAFGNPAFSKLNPDGDGLEDRQIP